MGFLFEAMTGLHSLLFPLRCPYCEREESKACEDCLAQWLRTPQTRLVEGVPIFSSHPYDERAMRVVLAAKERGEREARRFIVQSLADLSQRIVAHSGEEIFLVPIPGSTRALRRRGEDVIRELVERVVESSIGNVSSLPILTWSRDVRDQSSLSMRERARNLSGALIVDDSLVVKSMKELVRQQLVIVDDVLTSGATMAAAISAISHSSLGRSSLLAGITACYSVNPLFA